MSEPTKELKSDLAHLKKSSHALITLLLSQKFGIPRISTASSGGGDPTEGNLDIPPTATHTVLTANEIELLELYDEIEELNMAMMTLNEIRKMEAEATNGSKGAKVVRYTTDMSEVNHEEEMLLKEELLDKIRLLTHRNKLKLLAVEKYANSAMAYLVDLKRLT